MKVSNTVLSKNIKNIINNNLKFEKGTVSGYSIEVYEPETESFCSYIYYDDEENRDKDFEILCKLK